jgi:hypothetical protein
MNNFVKYRNHVLAKNSEAFSMLSAAERAKPEERKLLLKKLDQHLRDVERRYQELIK